MLTSDEMMMMIIIIISPHHHHYHPIRHHNPLFRLPRIFFSECSITSKGISLLYKKEAGKTGNINRKYEILILTNNNKYNIIHIDQTEFKHTI